MVINILNLFIDVNLIYIDSFKQLNEYKSYLSGEYKLISKFDDFERPLFGAPKEETKNYDLYEKDNKIYQYHKNNNGNYYALIEYNGKEVTIYNNKNNTFNDEYYLSQFAINYFINTYSNGVILYSSSIYYKNKGIIFTAKSGAGKSTHRSLWTKYSDALVINDDKNLIAIENDKLYIYPNPWCGKHLEQNNIRASLDFIVVLHQSSSNIIEDVDKSFIFEQILHQIPIPKNHDLYAKIVDKLADIKMYYYGCNISYEAFEVINDRISSDLL